MNRQTTYLDILCMIAEDDEVIISALLLRDFLYSL